MVCRKLIITEICACQAAETHEQANVCQTNRLRSATLRLDLWKEINGAASLFQLELSEQGTGKTAFLIGTATLKIDS